MPYSLRNTIALGSLVFVILAIGVYFNMIRYPGRLSAMEEEIKTIDKELQNTPDLLNMKNTLTEEVQRTKIQWATRIKAIPAADISSETYDYLIRTIRQSGAVKMDMMYKGIKNQPNYGFGEYDLKGDAPVNDFYRFLWFIENGRNLFKIRSITLKQVPTRPKEESATLFYASYQMIVEAYFSSIPELSTPTGERAYKVARLAMNPFYPAILPDIPPNTRNLVEIERSILKGVIADKAFVQDHENKIRELGEGEEVYLGYISKVDPERGKIEYILNKGGIIDKGELEIRRGTPIQ
jgi:hypothetical protein